MGAVTTNCTGERFDHSISRHLSVLAALLVALSVAIAFATTSADAQASGTAAVAWGSDGHYELGTGYMTTGTERQPVPVIGISGIKSVVSAGQTSYALLLNGTVKSWGANLKEELGDGVGARGEGYDRGARANPVPVLEKPNPGETGEVAATFSVAPSSDPMPGSGAAWDATSRIRFHGSQPTATSR